MEQVNLVVELDQRRTCKPLATFEALVGCASVVVVMNAPEDCDNFVVRVFAHDGASFYDFPCWRMPENRNSVKCRVLGTAFFAEGEEHYEVRAKDADGNDVGFGTGRLVVKSFSAGTPSGLPSTVRIVQVLPDAQGGLHQIEAVQDETGEWTYRFV